MSSLNKLIILIPFYNDKEELRITLQSISEPVSDFSIVIVDDGSEKSQSPVEIVEEFQSKYNIHLLSLPFNQGVRRALNHGILWIFTHKEFDYISILDCADLCEPERFSRQCSYLNENPHCMVLGGTAVYRDGNTGKEYKVIFPQDAQTIRKKMYINLMFCHPTIMFRKECIEKYDFYPPGFEHAEDHSFLFPIVLNSETSNLQEKMITCIIRQKGISCQNKNRQILSRVRLIWKYRDYSIYFFYGIIRNSLLLLLPKRIIVGIRTFFGKHKF